MADADGADEDGVAFGSIRVGALDAVVTVTVQGSAGKLDAWIDFNGDGNWGGVGERIFDSVDVNTGDNVLQYDVPYFAAEGETYARFRLSTQENVGPGGVVGDGEVEDYQVAIWEGDTLVIETAGFTDHILGGGLTAYGL